MLDAGDRRPVLIFGASEVYLGPTPTPRPTPTRVPPPPTPKKKKIVAKSTAAPASESIVTAPAVPNAPSFDFTFPLNSDQLAIMRAKGFAERTNSGDLVHSVNSAEQTVDSIVSWYTGSTAGLEEVLKYNALPEKPSLGIGQKIVIPRALVKQPKEMK